MRKILKLFTVATLVVNAYLFGGMEFVKSVQMMDDAERMYPDEIENNIVSWLDTNSDCDLTDSNNTNELTAESSYRDFLVWWLSNPVIYA